MSLINGKKRLCAIILIVFFGSSFLHAGWKPAKGPLMTRWAKDVVPNNAYAEYPRPQMVRKEWKNLNGLWEYAIVLKDAQQPVKLAGKSLHLNAKADFGEILVEVLDKNKKVIAKSKLLSKDSLDIGVEWDSGDLNAVNKPITLRITLRNALLFALWCS